jgi:hypothetical protein
MKYLNKNAERKLYDKVVKGKIPLNNKEKLATDPYHVFSVKHRFAPYFSWYGGFMLQPTIGLWKTEIAYIIITKTVGGLGLPSLMSMAFSESVKIKVHTGNIGIIECLGKKEFILDDLVRVIDTLEFEAAENFVKKQRWARLKNKKGIF